MFATPAHARPHTRPLAALLLGAVVALSFTLVSSPRADAAPPDDALTVEWREPGLWTDVDGDGRVDVGDEVVLAYTMSTSDWAVTDMVTAGPGFTRNVADMAAHESRGSSWIVTAREEWIDDIGRGLVNYGVSFTFAVDGEPGSVDLGPSPLISVPSPLVVGATTLTLRETGGTIPNALIEHESASYATTVTNDTDVQMTLSNPRASYANYYFPIILAPGDTATVRAPSRNATYADMVAGGMSWPDATLGWSTPDASGTVTVPIPTAATEPIDSSADVSVTTAVHASGGEDVPVGAAVAGDVIDFTFHIANTGNVTLQMLTLDATTPSLSVSLAIGSVDLRSGQSLPNLTMREDELTSGDTGTFRRYSLTAADVERGYVDLSFRVLLAPSVDAFRADRESHTYGFTPRVFLRDFTTSGTLTTTPTLNDLNGDGKGQEGETVTFDWAFTNTSNQDVTLTGFADGASADAAITTAAYDGTAVARGATAQGSFEYTLTAADEARRSVAVRPIAQVTGDADGAEVDVAASTTVTTGAYVAPEYAIEWALINDDENGDGKVNAGDTLHVTMTISNRGTYPLTGLDVQPDPSTIPYVIDPAFPGVIAAGESERRTFEHVVTPADEAAVILTFGVTATADGRSLARRSSAVVVAHPFVAPDTEFTTGYTVADANGDGFPSIGETVTYTVTLKNAGTYPLTSIALSDARGADVAGDFTGVPATLAAGETWAATFTHVLTAPDFARGSVSYAAALSADGTGGTVESTQSVVSGITFQAYDTGLDGVAEGGVTICTSEGRAVTALIISEDYWVTPGACGTGGDPTGYRVVAFSTPMLLATDSFQATVPGELGQGEHRIALYSPSGELYGWRAVTVSDPIGFSGVLAFTGASDDALALMAAIAAALLIVGAAAVGTAGLRPRRSL